MPYQPKYQFLAPGALMMPRANPIPYAQLLQDKKWKNQQLDKLANKQTKLQDSLSGTLASNDHDAAILAERSKHYNSQIDAINAQGDLSTGEKYRKIQILGNQAKNDDELNSIAGWTAAYEKNQSALEALQGDMDEDVYRQQQKELQERNKGGIGTRTGTNADFKSYNKWSDTKAISTPKFTEDVKGFLTGMKADKMVEAKVAADGTKTYLFKDKFPYYHKLTKKEVTEKELEDIAQKYVMASDKYNKFFTAKDKGAEIAFRASESEKIKANNLGISDDDLAVKLDASVDAQRAKHNGTIYDKEQYIDTRIAPVSPLLAFKDETVSMHSNLQGKKSGKTTHPNVIIDPVVAPTVHRVNEKTGIKSKDQVFTSKEQVIQAQGTAHTKLMELETVKNEILNGTSTLNTDEQEKRLISYALAEAEYSNIKGIESQFLTNLEKTHPEFADAVRGYKTAKEKGLIDPHTHEIKPFAGKKYAFIDKNGETTMKSYDEFQADYVGLFDMFKGGNPYNEDHNLIAVVDDKNMAVDPNNPESVMQQQNAESMYNMYKDSIEAQTGKTFTQDEFDTFLKDTKTLLYDDASNKSQTDISAYTSLNQVYAERHPDSEQFILHNGGRKLTGKEREKQLKTYETHLKLYKNSGAFLEPEVFERLTKNGIGNTELGFLNSSSTQEQKNALRDAAIAAGGDPKTITMMQDMFLSRLTETGGDMNDILRMGIEKNLKTVTDQMDDYLLNNETTSGSAANMYFEVKRPADLGKSADLRKYNQHIQKYQDAVDHVNNSLASFVVTDATGKELTPEEMEKLSIDVTDITGIALDDIGISGEQVLPIQVNATVKTFKSNGEEKGTKENQQYTIYSKRSSNQSLYDGLHSFITDSEFAKDDTGADVDIDPKTPGVQKQKQYYIKDDASSMGARDYAASLLVQSKDIDRQFEVAANNMNAGTNTTNTSAFQFHFVNLNDPFGAKNKTNPHSIAAKLAPANHQIQFTKTGTNVNPQFAFNEIQGNPLYSMYDNMTATMKEQYEGTEMYDDFEKALEDLTVDDVRGALKNKVIMSDPSLSNAILGMWQLKMAQKEFKKNNFKKEFSDMSKAKEYLKNVQQQYADADKLFRGVRQTSDMARAGEILISLSVKGDDFSTETRQYTQTNP